MSKHNHSKPQAAPAPAPTPAPAPNRAPKGLEHAFYLQEARLPMGTRVYRLVHLDTQTNKSKPLTHWDRIDLTLVHILRAMRATPQKVNLRGDADITPTPLGIYSEDQVL